MAKNNNYKQFTITKSGDVLFVLGDLISGVMYDLIKYKEYQQDLIKTITQYLELDDNGEIISKKPVPEKEFLDLDDRVRYRQMNMLIKIADEQKSSFSYKNLRKTAKKKGFFQKGLPEDVNKILNELLDVRNWSFHNTQSRFTAQEEVLEKSIPLSIRNVIQKHRIYNPVGGTAHQYFDISYLASLKLHMDKRIKQFELILEHMKADYTELYKHLSTNDICMAEMPRFQSGKVDFCINYSHSPKSLYDNQGKEVQISMAIQKGKYDGTDETFNHWIVNNDNNSEH